MSIHDKFLDGSTLYEKTLDRIRTFCTGKRVLCAFSGGKDSQACYHLLEDAGVPFDAQYSITRFEPPELLRFIRHHYPSVTFRRAYKNHWWMILRQGLPTRWGDGVAMRNIAQLKGMTSPSSASAGRNHPGGVTHGACLIRTDKTAYLCPICDWSTADVWGILETGRIRLYDQGCNRIGCVCRRVA